MIVEEVQVYAQCRWYSHWLGGDAQTRATDAAVIEQFPSWEFASYFAPSDPGPQILRDTVEQVKHGQETLVRQFITANCQD